MNCLSITYGDFRNIEKETLSFSPGVNLLWGENAQGKSNMLEGLYFFARGRSFRGAKEKELIRFGEKYAHLELDFSRNSDKFPVKLTAHIPTVGKKILYKNDGKLSSLKEMIGIFRAVLFSPTHLSLVSGGPALRRNFMDIAISQLYPAYLENLSKYNRLLLQRNALIKSPEGETASEGVWDAYALQMADLGADISKRRYDYMKDLAFYVSRLFADMTDKRETPELIYKSSALTEDEKNIKTEGRDILYRLLTENIQREVKYGATLYGIQKDEIEIRLNSRDAKIYASQGQQRSLALSMKLAEGEVSKKLSGEYPVFLLDDVLSELDCGRRDFVLSSLKDRQIIVTSCEPELFYKKAADRFIHIENGKIRETDI